MGALRQWSDDDDDDLDPEPFSPFYIKDVKKTQKKDDVLKFYFGAHRCSSCLGSSSGLGSSLGLSLGSSFF